MTLKSIIFCWKWIRLAMTCVKASSGKSRETLFPALTSCAAAILASGVILFKAGSSSVPEFHGRNRVTHTPELIVFSPETPGISLRLAWDGRQVIEIGQRHAIRWRNLQIRRKNLSYKTRFPKNLSSPSSWVLGHKLNLVSPDIQAACEENSRHRSEKEKSHMVLSDPN